MVVQKGICTDTSRCIPYGSYVNLPEDPLEQVSLYPNPSSGRFTVELNSELESVDWKIYDLQGRAVLHGSHPNTENLTFEVEGPPGLYFLHLSSEGKVKHFKLLMR